MGVILAYQLFLMPREPQPPPSSPRPPVEAPAPVPPAVPTATPALQAAAPPPASEDIARAVALQDQAGEKEITVSGGSYTATMGNRGALPTRWRLRDYPGADGQPLEILPVVPRGAIGPLALI